MVMTFEEKKAANKATKARYYKKNAEKIKANVREYALNNKEKVSAASKLYRAKNRDKLIANNKEWCENNSEKYKATAKNWRSNNKESIKDRTLDWVSNNRDKVNTNSLKYAKINRDKVNTLSANRRAKKFGATIYMTKEDSAKIEELYTIAKDATKLFGSGWEVDHIVPLAKGGLHKLSNLQVVPESWNRVKSDKNCDTYWD